MLLFLRNMIIIYYDYFHYFFLFILLDASFIFLFQYCVTKQWLLLLSVIFIIIAISICKKAVSKMYLLLLSYSGKLFRFRSFWIPWGIIIYYIECYIYIGLYKIQHGSLFSIYIYVYIYIFYERECEVMRRNFLDIFLFSKYETRSARENVRFLHVK